MTKQWSNGKHPHQKGSTCFSCISPVLPWLILGTPGVYLLLDGWLPPTYCSIGSTNLQRHAGPLHSTARPLMWTHPNVWWAIVYAACRSTSKGKYCFSGLVFVVQQKLSSALITYLAPLAHSLFPSHTFILAPLISSHSLSNPPIICSLL